MRLSPLRTRRILRRVGLFVVVVAAGSLTGLYWRSARAGDVVRADISVHIEASVQPDGAVSVTETLDLDPSLLDEEQLVRRIPTPDGTSAVLRSATDEAGRPLGALAGGGSTGNLPVRVELDHHATVVLRYTLLGAVDLHDGEAVAAMWWLGSENHVAIDELTASIVWPVAGGRASAVEGVVGGRRLEGERSGAGVRFDAGPVPASVIAGGGAAFDRAAVPGLVPGEGSAGGEGLARLPSLAGDAGTGPWDAVGVVVGLAVLAGWALLQRLRGGEHPVPADLRETRPPSSHTPAEVGWLLRFGEVRHGDLTATLIDLASRGYVIPYRREGRVVAGHGRPRTGLCPHEELVLDWLFPGNVRECDLDERNADIRQEPDKWAALWEHFVDEVRAVGRSNSLVERSADSGAVLGLGFAGLVAVALGVAGVAASHTGWLACVVAGAVVLAGSTAFARRSPEGALLAARWEAFGRSLRGEAVGELDSPPDLGPQALAYAVALHESTAAAAVLDAHQTGDAGGRWPTQLIDREVEAHVNRWQVSYLAATSIKGEPSERLRAMLSLRTLRRPRTGATGSGRATR